ncbi:5'-nucleotidase domain-containing protein 2 isoform X2 [Pseudoliparis swirei]|uniref:5'-nucleotidase domain-containing protein 2 isoform X2 n=1 Tax=Pseudoliparis swirei TaxID=2059687 RepID=UPI0024BEE1CC|nr:5'-nucleotidase domain-containing protein 2 isoform X2 [Pseudoliparis swirei]
MSFKAVSAAVTRTLWTRGHGIPPLARSPKVNRLSTTCSLLTVRKQGGEPHEQSCSADSDGANGDVHVSSEPPHRCNTGEEKRAKGPAGVPDVKNRPNASTAAPVNKTSYLWARYNDTKRLVHDLIPPGACNLLNSTTIYANNEVDLSEVDIYGFDYDYTLAMYSNALNTMIYNKARCFLIEHFKYPEGLCKYDYIPNFTVRGLHYDIQKGLLMKIDAFHYIQPGTVYRGLNPVSDEEVLQLFGGTYHVPLQQDSGFYGKGPKVKQFMDIFSIPEMTLLASANDFFITNGIDYDPVHLFKDISEAIGMVHVKGFMYKWVMEDLDKFILRGEETDAVLHRLVSHGKKMFLITNSPFSFVDKGMTYMVGKNWRDFFDVVIVQAEKPHFFTDCIKPFRRLDANGDLMWEKITCLDKGQIYKQGNLFDFLRLTGWRGSRVLYFGDHLYSDLADLMLRHGWRTAAIVPELEPETNVVSTDRYGRSLTWLQALTGLMENLQVHRDPESKRVFEEWQIEREELKWVPLIHQPDEPSDPALSCSYHG